MKSIQNFLDLYPKRNSRLVYSAGINCFFEFIYGFKKEGKKVTESERKQFEKLAEQYFSEGRDIPDDLLRFSAYLHTKPPKTAKSYMAGVKEYLGYNDVELTTRESKQIRLKLPRGGVRTVEKDMTPDVIKKVTGHMDIKGRALVLTLASSGMRIGEALQITLNDVDLKSNPPTITIRGEYTKTGEQRFTFINKEARESIDEWLKVRNTYIHNACNKTNGLVQGNYAKPKNKDDNRLFPFSEGVVSRFWDLALQRAVMYSVDNGTNRVQLHIHQLRKFFRSQLALGCPVDIVEGLMGHEGYLSEAYRRYTRVQMAEHYLKHEHLLYIHSPIDAQTVVELRSKVAELTTELHKMKKSNEELTSEVHDATKEITYTPDIIKTLMEENKRQKEEFELFKSEIIKRMSEKE